MSADANSLTPPVAPKRPHRVPFGAVEGENRGENPFLPLRYRDDPWFWIRDDERKNEEVLGLLRAENAYTAQETAHLEKFRTKLYDEHISHLKQTDEKPAYPHGEFYYYTRTVEGKSYRIHCRKKASSLEELAAATEEVILDENVVAEGKSQCVVLGVTVSPDHTMLAYSVDFTGAETYSIIIKDLATMEESGPQVTGVAGPCVWGADTATIYYLAEDPAKRPHKLFSHAVGSEQSSDTCLWEEKDELYYMGLCKSKDGRYVLAMSDSSETSEVRFVDLQGDGRLVTVQPRQFGLRYSVEHSRGRFVVVTNIDKALNNRLMTAPVGTPGKEHWAEAIPYDDTRKIDEVEVFEGYLALEGRQDGLTQVWTAALGPEGSVLPDTLKRIQFEEPIYECGISTNMVYGTAALRVHYSSLTTPLQWLDYDMGAGGFTMVKQEEVLAFDSSLYECRREFATANDGTRIPMSVVQRKDLPPGPQPTFLYGYGSYGICVDPCFHPRILPYLDRGVVYAIANIRGGEEMGRYWYEEQGKYLNKRNTFSDFVNCAEHLVAEGVAAPGRLAIEGRSAGGLLMGAVVNMRPDLFNVCVAGVPFVDCFNTMSDPSIPLTCGEWEEWGNPNENKYFDYMLSYSPYDNVREQPYPQMLITAGLHDPRVAYWEPEKWAQRLRECNTGSSQVLVKMDLEAGHFSASDRYRLIREKSFEQAYVLSCLGLQDEDTK